MKKAAFLFLAAMLAALCSAFTVEQFAPVSGVPFAIGSRGGKLVSVEVFAPTNGTVALSSIYEAALFEDVALPGAPAYTNVTVVSSNRLADLTVPWTYPVTNVTVYTNAAFKTVHTNVVVSFVTTNLPAVVALDTNAYPLASFSLAAWRNAYPLHALISVSTNEVPASSGGTSRVYSRSVAVTNALVSGTAEACLYSGAPASATYLAPGEKLVFTGTATGGFLRLVLE